MLPTLWDSQAIARKMAHGTIIWRDLGVMVKMNDVNYVHAHVCALACIHHFLVCIHAGISVFQKFTISSGIWHAEELFWVREWQWRDWTGQQALGTSSESRQKAAEWCAAVFFSLLIVTLYHALPAANSACPGNKKRPAINQSETRDLKMKSRQL